jgi:hypothetical protein
MVAGHVSWRATILVTASGGGWKCEAACTAEEICRNFMKPKLDNRANITTNINIIRFAMNPSFKVQVGEKPQL